MNITMLETVETAVEVQVLNRRGKPAVRSFAAKLLRGTTYGPVPDALRDRLVGLGHAAAVSDDADGVVALPIPAVPASGG